MITRSNRKKPQQKKKPESKKKITTKWTKKKILDRYLDLGKGGSYTSAYTLSRNIPADYKVINEAMSQSRALQQLKRVRKKFPRNSVKAIVFHYLSLDLKDFSSISDENDDYKWILFAIDLGSRYLYTEPLKDKRATTVLQGLKNVFEAMSKRNQPLPRTVMHDAGREFDNKQVSAFLKKEGIHQFRTYDPFSKASVVERCIRTISSMIYRYFTVNNTLRWISVLQPIVASYNATIHSATKLRPDQTTIHDSHSIFMQNLKPARSEPVFKVGDYVFVARYKKLFSKGYTESMTGEIFKVDAVRMSTPVTYILRDLSGELIKGSFYKEELSKTTLPEFFEVENIVKTRKRKGKKEYLVKWRYYKDTNWVKEEDLMSFDDGQELDKVTSGK